VTGWPSSVTLPPTRAQGDIDPPNDMNAVVQWITDLRTELGSGSLKGASADLSARLTQIETANSYDVRSYGAKIDGKLKRTLTTSAGNPQIVFGGVHNIVTADIGKTGWVIDDLGSFGPQRTIQTIDSTTQITMSGPVGKDLVGTGTFVFGTPIDAALTQALSDATLATFVNTAAGVNSSWGPIGGTRVTIQGGTGIAIITGSNFFVNIGVCLDPGRSMLYAPNGTATPIFRCASNTSIGKLHMVVGDGKALTIGDSTSAQAHFFADEIVIWATHNTTYDLVELDGNDYLINFIWTKGGDTAIKMNVGSDCRINAAFTIGAATGISVGGANQWMINQIADSCTVGARIWGGSEHGYLNQIEFKYVTSSGTTRPVVFDKKDDGAETSAAVMNNDIRLDIQSRDAGNNVLELQYCQNVKANVHIAPPMSAGATAQSARGQTTFVAYGTNVGDGIWVDVTSPSFTQKLNDNTTPAYKTHTGTPVGRYKIAADALEFWVNGAPSLWVSGTTAPVTAALVTSGTVGPQGAVGPTGPTGPVGLFWRGVYSATATYALGDAITYLGLSYVAKTGTTGNTPPNSTYWDVLSGLNSFDQDRATLAGAFEIFPASMMNSGAGLTLTSGKQEYVFFQALNTTPITKVRFSTQNAATTTTHAFVGIYAVDGSWQPTTQLKASADTTAFITSSSFQSMYDSGGINNQFTLSSSWTPAYGTWYALGLLWTGTGSPSIHTRLIDAGSAKAGYSTAYGTHYCAGGNGTGLVALVATGAPAETAANLVTNSRGSQMGALFVP
jgi:hypothetical protein